MIAHAIRWAVGGLLYGGLELLYRGRTHWTMLLLAALLCVPLDLANEHIPWEWPLWAQAVAGGTVITAAEIQAIAAASVRHKLYHTTLCNHLLTWARRAETKEELSGITYASDGMPEDLAANMAAVLAAAAGDNNA